jgi:lysophospholipase L1-like esterase
VVQTKARLFAAVSAAHLWMSCQCVAAPASWVGAFAHVPTAYNLSAPTKVTGRDATLRVIQPVYAPLPVLPASTTVREVVRSSAAARSIRIRFSNEFGNAGLHIGEAHIALADVGGSILAGSDHILTFSGQRGVSIPVGAPILSDPIDWDLPPLSKLSISVFYPDEVAPPAHTVFALNAWAASGDQAGEQTLTGAVAARSGNHFSEIDIVPRNGGRAVVCLGDSTTEGVASTVGNFRAWPDRLAERLQSNALTRNWAVVNAGVGSNRLLHDTPSINALARFDRDALSVPGVSKIIIYLGINDIQYSHRNPAEAVNADDMISALRQLATRAHAKGIDVVGATITPFEGSADYSAQGEAVRVKVNEWIRTNTLLDGVVDFDRAIRDPTHPARLLGTADSGGHLHPGDVGYAMMGDAVDLKMFLQ